MSEISWRQLFKILLPIKLQISNFSVKSSRLLIKILNRGGSNVEPGGTPVTISDQEF